MKFIYAFPLYIVLMSQPLKAFASDWYCDYSWDGQLQQTQLILKLVKVTQKASNTRNESKTDFNNRFDELFDIYAKEQKMDWGYVESIANYMFERYQTNSPNKMYMVGFIDHADIPNLRTLHAVDQFYTANGANIIDDYMIRLIPPDTAIGSTGKLSLTRYVINRENQKLEQVITSIVDGTCILKERAD